MRSKQYRLGFARRELLVGVNCRHASNDNTPGAIFRVDPQSSDDEVVGAFIQDQIQLSNTLQLTLGTKLEDNDFSGFELQPSVRLTWDISELLSAASLQAATCSARCEKVYSSG